MIPRSLAINRINKKIRTTISKPAYFHKGHPCLHVGNDTGILLLPGFANTSHIMREYETYFINQGYTVYNTTLPGRGTTLDDFKMTTWREWVEYAIEDYLLLRSLVKKVFIAGFSTGGTIALYIAQHVFKEILPNGLILLSPAINLRYDKIPLSLQITALKLYSLIDPYPRKFKDNHLVYSDPVARAEYDILPRIPAQSIIELMQLIKLVKKDIRKVTIPTVIMHSVKDVIINPISSRWVFDKINAVDKSYIQLYESGHPIVVDVEKNKVFKESLKFIERISGSFEHKNNFLDLFRIWSDEEEEEFMDNTVDLNELSNIVRTYDFR